MNELSHLTDACEARREKHIELHEAIQNLDSITRHLDDLIERLQGPIPKNVVEANAKPGNPNFLDVLNGGAGAIHKKTEMANDRIAQVIELLF